MMDNITSFGGEASVVPDEEESDQMAAASHILYKIGKFEFIANQF